MHQLLVDRSLSQLLFNIWCVRLKTVSTLLLLYKLWRRTIFLILNKYRATWYWLDYIVSLRCECMIPWKCFDAAPFFTSSQGWDDDDVCVCVYFFSFNARIIDDFMIEQSTSHYHDVHIFLIFISIMAQIMALSI